MALVSELYDRDFYEWSQENARLLREGRVHEADVPNIAQEIADLGINQRRELASRLRHLLNHLLKVRYAERPRFTDSLNGWLEEIRNHREDLEDLLERMPSLERFIEDEIEQAYRKARKRLLDEGFANAACVTEKCPFSREQIFDLGFIPEYRPA